MADDKNKTPAEQDDKLPYFDKQVINFDEEKLEKLQFYIENLVNNNISLDENIDVEVLNAACNIFLPLVKLLLASQQLRDLISSYYDLQPFIENELNKPQYNGKTTLDLLHDVELDERGEMIPGSLFEQAFTNAELSKQSFAANITEPSIAAHKPKALEFPLFKGHDDIFTKLILSDAKNNIPGQYSFNVELSTESAADKKSHSFLYSIMFNEFEDKKAIMALNDYDRRVYDAVSTLYNAGNTIFSLSQIHRVMCGDENNTSVSAYQKRKVSESLHKMSMAWIEIDQSNDYAKYTSLEYGKIGVKYSGQLLYFDKTQVSINGRHTEDAIRMLQEPVLFRLAKDRKQITTIPNNLLVPGKNLTPSNLAIENYLFNRISQMKNDKRNSSKHIKYEAIYERLNIPKSDRKKRSRAIDTAFELLAIYIDSGWITSYKADTNKKGEAIIRIDPTQKTNND